ncbi:50S ribosomal protein L13 [Candidatus Oleimmundimicrobium sp.]|uniref:50S ribosomal protein L13 n=1 Tax=Candidatus Oleimmundimicrobium sp. TaxID=3060597 RepID=UPI002721B381|nr:50S ribosomal protein L13 [Candidatus Oleimmundimicrobium sp.]MDO8886028.1 50S ribosomal protein L13 [Candidatus Oleimmundimicrobium sp.]
MKTYSAKLSDIQRAWHVVDAEGVPLGRLASEVAQLIRGKHKPMFTPHMDTGDHVIVINAEKVKLTGKKLEQKKHFSHSGYPGGIKLISYDVLIEKKPAFVIKKAVKGMLPHNRLGRVMIKKLKVYAGSDHKHQAQNPKIYKLKYVKGEVSDSQ